MNRQQQSLVRRRQTLQRHMTRSKSDPLLSTFRSAAAAAYNLRRTATLTRTRRSKRRCGRYLVDLGDEEQMVTLYALLHRQPQVVRHYLFDRVFPRTMEFQQMKLSAWAGAWGRFAVWAAYRLQRNTIQPAARRKPLLCQRGRCADASRAHLPSVVRYTTPLPSDWSAISLLRSVANWTPRCTR